MSANPEDVRYEVLNAHCEELTSRVAKAERYLRIAVPFLRRGERFDSLADAIEDMFGVPETTEATCPTCAGSGVMACIPGRRHEWIENTRLIVGSSERHYRCRYCGLRKQEQRER